MLKSSRNKKREIVEVWESLEIPKHNWDELGQTGNLRFLIKDEKKFESKHLNKETLKGTYLKLMDQYFLLVGDDFDREELMMFKKELTRARCLLVLGDKFQINWVNFYEGEIQSILKSAEDVDPDETYMKASKWLGAGLIDTKKISVIKWIKLLKTIEKENAMLSNQYGKGAENE